MKKKVIIVFSIILMLFNFISYKSCSIAVEGEESDTAPKIEVDIPNSDKVMDVINGGKIKINKNVTLDVREKEDNTTSVILVNSSKSGISAIGNAFNEFVKIIGIVDDFTVYDLVMGKYEFFNMDFTKIRKAPVKWEDSMADWVAYIKDSSEELTLADKIKTEIITFYFIFRNLSLGLSLFVLIYVGIRMAISTTSDKRVKYKKMFTNWIASILLLFVMHFLIIIVSYLNGFALKIINDIATSMDINNFETDILIKVFKTSAGGSGFHGIGALIVWVIFLYYEIKFFLAYMHRFFEIAFLITIAPLVTITYSIDKVKDNRAQAFTNWFKELSIKYSIQVVHAITYCVFIFTAGAIAQQLPIVGAFFLLAISRAEKIFRNILNVPDKNFEKAKVPFLDKRLHRFFKH